MRLVYLITAYKDPVHLRRLIASLDGLNIFFYVHIDLNVNIKEFLIFDFPENVVFIEKRYRIQWGSYSQVKSIISLIDSMLANCKEKIDRVALISGQDYPIISNKEIIKTFENNPSREFIIGYNLTLDKERSRKVTKYHFLKIANHKKRKWFQWIANKIAKKRPMVFFNSKYHDVYFGSDYWALTFDCLLFVYNTFKSEGKLRRYFMYSFVPSELFVHTIVFNSRFAENAEIRIPEDYYGLYTCTPLHYIVYRESIKVFSTENYDEIVASNKMFFRKANTAISSELLNKIDLYRKEKI